MVPYNFQYLIDGNNFIIWAAVVALVGKAVTSNNRDPRFEFNHLHILSFVDGFIELTKLRKKTLPSQAKRASKFVWRNLKYVYLYKRHKVLNEYLIRIMIISISEPQSPF